MIDCPKCGFSQPEDRYCANCGVDVAAYQPPAVPISRRVFAHWAFQVTVVGATIVATWAYLESRRKAALFTQVQVIEGTPETYQAEPEVNQSSSSSGDLAGGANGDLERQASLKETAPKGLSVPAKEALPRAAVAKSAIDGGARPEDPFNAQASGSQRAAESRVAPVSADAATSSAPLPLGAPSASAPPKSLLIVMGEFRRAFVDEVLATASEGRGLNAYGAGSNGGVALLADPAARVNREAVRSPAISSEALSAGQTISILKAVRDAQSKNVGFTVLATPSSIDENGVVLNVEVVRAMRESTASAVQEQSFPDSFSIRPQRIGFMVGLVPRRQPDALEKELYAPTPLQILASAAFQSGASEFAVFFIPTP